MEKIVDETFQDHCDNGLFTLKLQLSDYLTEALARFEGLKILQPPPFEQYSVYVKGVNRHTPKHLSSRMAEILEVTKQDMSSSVTASTVQVSTSTGQERSAKVNSKEK